MSKFKAIIGIAAVIGIAFAAYRAAHIGPDSSQQIATARAWAGLAPLPPSAAQLHVSEAGALTWGAYYLRFSAPQRDINAFIAESPGLRRVKAEVFTPKHKLLPLARGKVLADQQLEDGNAHIVFGVSGPSWFDETVLISGRRYAITYGGNFGELVVNDVSHTVYVYVADS